MSPVFSDIDVGTHIDGSDGGDAFAIDAGPAGGVPPPGDGGGEAAAGPGATTEAGWRVAAKATSALAPRSSSSGSIFSYR